MEDRRINNVMLRRKLDKGICPNCGGELLNNTLECCRCHTSYILNHSPKREAYKKYKVDLVIIGTNVDSDGFQAF